MLKLYCIWSLIYLPFVLVGWMMQGFSFPQDLFTYMRNFLFEGSFLTIWFLNALWLAMALVYVLLKRFSARTVFVLSLPFYVLACLLSSYNGLLVQLPGGAGLSELYYSLLETTKNGLLFGFPYVALGALVKSEISKTKPQASAKIYALAGLSFVVMVIEVLARNSFFPDNKGVDFCFALVPVTYFVLRAALQCRLPDSPKYLYLRKLSILIFLVQRLFLTGFTWADAVLASVVGYKIFTAVPAVYFVLVAGGSLVLSAIILRLSKRWKWLSCLY